MNRLLFRVFVSLIAITAFSGIALIIGCGNSAGSGGGEVNLADENQKLSYALGVQIGNQFRTNYIEIESSAFLRGVEDAMSGNLMLSAQEIDSAMQTFQMQQEIRMEQAVSDNLVEASAFLAKNGARNEVVTLADSLQYEVIEPASGPRPVPGDTVRVHYTGTFMDESEFDSSVGRGEPISFVVGQQQVIPGWDRILQEMPEGSTWRVFIPPNLAYGPQGRPGIPPNSLLIFEMELVEVIPSNN